MGDEEPTGEEILDALGDCQARRILREISSEALSAKEIGQRLELSLPTVYRRLDTLESCDLIEARILVAENGNHYKVFECDFESTVITLNDEQFDAEVYHSGALPERFSNLWEALGSE